MRRDSKMQLNTALQQKLGTDLSTITRVEGIEAHTTALVEGIGRGTKTNVSQILADIPDIAAYQLLKRLVCDLGDATKVLMRIEIEYDWVQYRLTIKRDGERVAMMTIPGTMTHPAMIVQASALQILIQSVCMKINISKVDWTYTLDPLAIEKRGESWISKRLDICDHTPENQRRFDAFEAGRSVRQTLNDSPFQSVLVSFSKELG